MTGENEQSRDASDSSRRTFLKATAATGALTAAGGVAGAQDTPTPTPTPTQNGGQEGYFSEGPTVGLEPVVSGDPLVQPVGFRWAQEEEQRYFVVDQVGQIYVITPEGELREEPFLDIQDRLVAVGEATDVGFDERGLLGLEFHPDFAENRRFFVRYSAPPREGTPDEYDHTGVLSEFQASEDLSTADPESEQILIEVPEPQFNHNAGDIAFGPDGLLYVPWGDGGAANDVGLGHVQDWYDENDGGNGQDVTQNFLGSLLRIDVDQEGEDRPYAIPEDNPLVDAEGSDEQWAWGFRNPWRISFNDGTLIVADVGQNLWEEVDVVEQGGNYGWNVREATTCFNAADPTSPLEECPDSTPDDVRGGEPLLPPVVEYPHQVDGQPVGVSVTGGYVYQGEAVSELQGQYVFGDWSRTGAAPAGRLFVASPPEGAIGDMDGGMDGNVTGNDTGNVTGNETGDVMGNETGNESENAAGVGAQDQMWDAQELVVEGTEDGTANRYVLAFGRDRNGELYVVTSETSTVQGTGGVWRIVAPEEGAEVQSPTPQPTPTPGANETPANETMDNVTAENETLGNETPAENETMGNETAENETEGRLAGVGSVADGLPLAGSLAALGGVGAVLARAAAGRGDEDDGDDGE